jgi:hypothetical protein
MRLSEWRATAPTRESMTLKVLAVVEPVLHAIGAEPDPECWVAWGDDPAIRYSILVPVAPGLITCVVRVNIAGEGPRASAKLTRWNRVQVGELAVETQAGHRVATFQVEQHVLRGADGVADRVARFALALFAAVDGRPVPDAGAARAGRRKAAGTKPAAAAAEKAAQKVMQRAAPAPRKPKPVSVAARTSERMGEQVAPKPA